MQPRAADALALLAILAGFGLLALLLPVGAAPPIGDAWSYAWSARELAERGALRLTDFQAMSLVGQLWLTRPFTWAFSAEPGVLNALTFAFSAATACVFFGLLRAAGAPLAAAALGVATLVANPLFLAQSMTYDTEIYFLFASGLGALGFVLWLRSGRAWQAVLAGAGFALAILIRQHAIVFPVAAAATLAWRRRSGERGAGGTAGIVAALAVAPLALAAFYAWLRFEHGVPKAYLLQQAELAQRLEQPAMLAAAAALGAFASLHYLALFVASFLPALAFAPPPRRRRLLAYALAAVGVAAGTALLWANGHRMPYLPNLVTLHEVFLPHALLRQQALIQVPLTALTALLAAVLVAELAARPPRARPGAPAAFLAVSAALLLGFSIATGIRFERYLLPPLAFLIPLFALAPVSRRALAGGAACSALLGLASLLFVDQRVRFAACEWDAAHAALALEPARADIDGGVAFNGYFSYEEIARRYPHDPRAPWHPALHPGAALLVRPLPLPEHRYELVGRHRCPNRPGLADLELLLYRLRR
jgi:hypothetical protein